MAADRRTKIVATIGPASSDERTLARLDRRRDGRRAAELLARHARRPRAERAARTGGAGERGPADRADRRSPGTEAQDRRPLASRSSSRWARRSSWPERRPRGKAISRSRPPFSGRCSSPSQDVLVDDGHVRLRVLDVDAGRVLLPRRHRRRRRAAQGRERPGREPPRAVADAEGPRRPRLRARAGRRLRRAVVRPLAGRRRRAARADRGGRLAGLGHREDRAQGGGRRARRHPRRVGRRDDRARRPGRRGRRGRGSAPPEARSSSRRSSAGSPRSPRRRCSRRWCSGRSRHARRPPTSRTRSSTARRR